MAGGVGQVAEWLPTKHKDPSSNPSIAKSKSSAILLLEVRTSSLHQSLSMKNIHIMLDGKMGIQDLFYNLWLC